MWRTILGGPVVPEVKNVRAGEVGVRVDGVEKGVGGWLERAVWKSVTPDGTLDEVETWMICLSL